MTVHFLFEIFWAKFEPLLLFSAVYLVVSIKPLKFNRPTSPKRVSLIEGERESDTFEFAKVVFYTYGLRYLILNQYSFVVVVAKI